MDDIDLKILEILQNNAKISNINISKKIGLTAPSTLERVKKLEELGIIEGYYTKFKKEELGYSLAVFIEISLVKHTAEYIRAFINVIKNIPEIIEYYHVTGRSDFLIKAYAKDIKHLQDFLINKLSSWEVISRAETFMILEEQNLGIDLKQCKVNKKDKKKRQVK